MKSAPEIDLDVGSVAIGDLHLDVASSEAVSAFEAFLERVRGRPALILLGDLFEYWIGGGQARSSGGKRSLAALRALAGSGTEVLVVPGNRDFLLSRSDERQGGFRLFPSGFVAIDPAGDRTLVLHGDELCTRDRAYQRLRRVVRSRPIRLLAGALPDAMSEIVAKRLRRASTRAVARKPAADKRPQPDEVVRRARALDCASVLNGHVHEYRDELVEGVRWLCVDAFGDDRDAFELDRAGWVARSSAELGTGRLGPRAMTIIAIDGPSGVGKSTVARLLAARLGLFFLDTGAMYRAVTRTVLERGIDPEDGAGCERAARDLRLEFDDKGALLVDGEPAGAGIRTEHVTRNVSRVSAHAGVRNVIVALQRAIVEERGGAVAEGRDTTTVVFPDADLKIFLTASAMERARRRSTELGIPDQVGRILEEICRRDEFDSTRPHSPLMQARDAVRLESDGQSAEQVAERIAKLVASAKSR